jgi:hypothetical protein
MKQLQFSSWINRDLALKVIELHNDGYDFDFSITPDRRIICMQDNRSFSPDEISIKVTDLNFDQLSNSYKYVHTVETCCGDKGLLIANCICVNAFLESRFCCKQENRLAIEEYL